MGAVRAFSTRARCWWASPGSALLEARPGGRVWRCAAEAFADRAYEPDGTLRARSLPGAVHDGSGDVAAQALSIAARWPGARRTTAPGSRSPADTLCLHGDAPGAVASARAVRRAFEAAGVGIAPFVQA